jgi:hypothetical protein
MNQQEPPPALNAPESLNYARQPLGNRARFEETADGFVISLSRPRVGFAKVVWLAIGIPFTLIGAFIFLAALLAPLASQEGERLSVPLTAAIGFVEILIGYHTFEALNHVAERVQITATPTAVNFVSKGILWSDEETVDPRHVLAVHVHRFGKSIAGRVTCELRIHVRNGRTVPVLRDREESELAFIADVLNSWVPH